MILEISPDGLTYLHGLLVFQTVGQHHDSEHMEVAPLRLTDKVNYTVHTLQLPQSSPILS